MVKLKIKGKTCSFNLNLPKQLDQTTKEILINIFSYCLDEESKDKVSEAVENLLQQTDDLIKSIKDAKKYDKSIEQGIREFIGIHVKHGFDVGMYYTPGEDGPELLDVISDQFDYNKIVSSLSGTKEALAEIIFYCLDLARLAEETGMVLAYYLEEELVEQNQKELKKYTSYIQ